MSRYDEFRPDVRQDDVDTDLDHADRVAAGSFFQKPGEFKDPPELLPWLWGQARHAAYR